MSRSSVIIGSLLVLNGLTLAGAYLLVQKIGGFRYTWYRYKTNDAGSQMMRRQHFESLPTISVKQNELPLVIMLGDSQVQNAEWQELFGDSIRVLNRGIIGDHVRGVHERISEVVRHQASTIFLWVGVNDLFFGQKLEDLELMYTKLVTDLQSQCPNTKICVCTIVPVQSSVRAMPLDNQVIRAYNQLLSRIALEKKCVLVDINAKLSDQNGDLNKEYTLDGVHLNDAAYRLVKEEMEVYLPKAKQHNGI